MSDHPAHRQASPVADDQKVPITSIRWIVVGYLFWVGVFLGAVIMRAATHY
jgi:hypothetical protein